MLFIEEYSFKLRKFSIIKLKIVLKKILSFFIILNFSCNTGNLPVIADLPNLLNEASGIETVSYSNIIWMLNDGGNPSELYGLDLNGNILKVLKINTKNNDWEDLTSDNEGNIYIGDFGNNANKRKNLAIIKLSKDSLFNSEKISAERISFYYPNQTKFPPKKKKMHFDCEAFFHFNDSLYLFTKSREKNNLGMTNLYKIPASPGNHEAQFISSFNTCNESKCWITSADISADGKQIVILTPKGVWIFTDYTSDNFFNGNMTKFRFSYDSQKESVCFKDKNTLLITDEKGFGKGGNLYEFKLK
jgi:hypothetical protein